MNIIKVKDININSEKNILTVLFTNGVTKTIDFKEKFKDGKYIELIDKDLFTKAKVDVGGYGVSWSDDIDISEYELWNTGNKI